MNEQINTLEETQNKLDIIQDKYNQYLNKSFENKNNQFIKLSNQQIEDSIYVKKLLKVHKGLFVHYEGKQYCPINDSGKRIYMENKVVVRNNLLNDELFILDKNKKYLLQEIDGQMIEHWVNEITNNEVVKLEKEKRKMMIQNRNIRIAFDKKETQLKIIQNKLKNEIKKIGNKKLLKELQEL